MAPLLQGQYARKRHENCLVVQKVLLVESFFFLFLFFFSSIRLRILGKDTYVDRGATFLFASSTFVFAFLLLLAARFRYNLRVAHVQGILLECARSFRHSAATKCRYQLCERVWFAFVLGFVHFLQFRVLERLLKKEEKSKCLNETF